MRVVSEPHQSDAHMKNIAKAFSLPTKWRKMKANENKLNFNLFLKQKFIYTKKKKSITNYIIIAV